LVPIISTVNLTNRWCTHYFHWIYKYFCWWRLPEKPI